MAGVATWSGEGLVLAGRWRRAGGQLQGFETAGSGLAEVSGLDGHARAPRVVDWWSTLWEHLRAS